MDNIDIALKRKRLINITLTTLLVFAIILCLVTSVAMGTMEIKTSFLGKA